MSDTGDLIARLSVEATPKKWVATPSYWSLRLLAVCAFYAVGSQLYLNLRADLVIQLSRPLFVAEIAVLLLLLVTSALAAVYSMYPDAYQKPQFLKLPYIIFAALIALMLFQLFMPHDARMALPETTAHGMECALCLSAIAFIRCIHYKQGHLPC
jgi:hypothetical protein